MARRTEWREDNQDFTVNNIKSNESFERKEPAAELQLANIERNADDIKLEYAYAEPKELNINMLQNNLEHCLDIIEDEVMKGYITKLDKLSIKPFSKEESGQLKDIHFFKISELVYQEDEFSVDKLSMIFNSLSNKPCTLVLMLKSNGKATDFYLGARPDGNNSAGTLFNMLKQTLLGFFPGSKIDTYFDEDMKKDMESMRIGSVSVATCIADYKQEEETVTNKNFIQGLEKFVYAMQNREYTALFIADNVGYDELMERKIEYQQICTQISPFVNMQMNFSVSDGGSTALGSSDGITKNYSNTSTRGTSETETNGITNTSGKSETLGETNTESDTYTDSESTSDGKTHTMGTSDGVTNTVTDGTSTSNNIGVSLGVSFSHSKGKNHSESKGVTHTKSVSDSISKTLTHGFSKAKGTSIGKSYNYGENSSESESNSIAKGINESKAYTEGQAVNFVNTKTLTDTFGSSKGITLNSQNMSLKTAMDKLQKHLERIEECESFGMWNFAAYFLGSSSSETETAANTYKSVMSGLDTGIERNAVNTWTNDSEDDNSVRELCEYLKNFVHPSFYYNGFSYDNDRQLEVKPTALVSTNELAIHMGLPRKSVSGLPVIEHAEFGKEVVKPKNRDEEKNNSISLGKIYNMGQEIEGSNVELDIKSLAMHTFITGSTGKGKSTAIYEILEKLITHNVDLEENGKEKIKFMVIEPAKGEYKDRFGMYENVNVYGTNYKKMPLLRINPFSFPEDIHILEHIDRLIEIFNVCWPMYAAMPAVLKDSIERAYVVAGWNLSTSECRYINKEGLPLYPSFIDVLKQINVVMNESEYSSDSKGDYKGALCTRLKSLTNGLYGQIFTNDELSGEELFESNVIIDLSRAGSSETKSLIMGLLVMKLQEYRMANAVENNAPLKHVTVLEEAHNILKKTSTEQTGEGANMIGKSVEMLANSIAEMRTYGEGFIIVDQAPGLMDMSVIRNTNTKIILGLPDLEDRELVGRAAGLNDEQIVELSKLETFVAAVYQNSWLEPVLCKIDYKFKKQEKYSYNCEKRADTRKDKVLELLMMPINEKKKLDSEYIDNLVADVYKVSIPSEAKISFIKYVNATEKSAVQKYRENVVYSLFNSKEALNLVKNKIGNMEFWVESLKEVLEPDITNLEASEQNKIIATIIKEHTKFAEDVESKNLFNRFMSYI